MKLRIIFGIFRMYFETYLLVRFPLEYPIPRKFSPYLNRINYSFTLHWHNDRYRNFYIHKSFILLITTQSPQERNSNNTQIGTPASIQVINRKKIVLLCYWVTAIHEIHWIYCFYMNWFTPWSFCLCF